MKQIWYATRPVFGTLAGLVVVFIIPSFVEDRYGPMAVVKLFFYVCVGSVVSFFAFLIGLLCWLIVSERWKKYAELQESNRVAKMEGR